MNLELLSGSFRCISFGRCLKLTYTLDRQVQGVFKMTNNETFDEAKGKAKETAGKVTDDKRTEAEGKVEKNKAKVKDKAEDVKDSVGGAVEGLKDSDENNQTK